MSPYDPQLDGEITALRDEERTSDDEDGIGRREEHPFFEKLRAKTHRRREFAEAFTREQSVRPSVEDLLENQRKQATQLARFDRSLGRLRRSVLVANLCSGAMALAFLGLAGYFYTHMVNDSDFTAPVTSENGSVARQGIPSSAPMMSELVLASDLEFEIRTDVDRKYQLIIRELFNNMRTIHRPDGLTEIRNAATSDYIQYMVDVSQVIERAAQDQASPEITLAIINLAMVGQELRKVERITDLNVENQNKLDQIKTILRARDARSRNPEIRPATQNR